jgi:hypothetical protein
MSSGEHFKIQDLIIRFGSETEMILKNQIQLCNRSQRMIGLEDALQPDLERLQDHLRQILSLVDQSLDDQQQAVSRSA